MGYIKVYNRADTLMFPESFDEYVSDDNIVRLMDAFVETLSFEKIGFLRAVPAKEGRPGYDPRDMLKLYIYGYFYRIRSSRRLERETGRNIELIWMMGKIRPDFRTISDYRKDNKDCLKEVFKEFNKFCDKIGLYSKDYIAIDGSKFRGVNSKDSNFTLSKLDDRLKRVDEQIEDYLAVLEHNDEEETKSDNKTFTAKEIKEKIEQLNKRKEKYEGIRKDLETSGETQVSLTDHESKLMKSNNGGFEVSYNVQTAVDAGSHMIAGFEVTGHANDSGLLQRVSQAVKDDFGLNTLENTADKGYQDKVDMMNCLEAGIIPNVIPSRGQDGYDLETVYEEKEISAEQKAGIGPDDLQACLRAGVIPEVYREIISNIKVIEKTITVTEEKENQHNLSDEEMKAKAASGNFVRDKERNLVYCPAVQILRQKTERKNGVIRYWNKLGCLQCKNKCTKSKCKTVDFSANATIVVCNNMKATTADSVPENSKEDKPKQSVKKEKVKVKIVTMHLKIDKKKCDNRKCLSEHPFGTVKRALDSSYLLLKGKAKVTAELALSFLAYNIRRAVNVMGVKKLMEVIAE